MAYLRERCFIHPRVPPVRTDEFSLPDTFGFPRVPSAAASGPMLQLAGVLLVDVDPTTDQGQGMAFQDIHRVLGIHLTQAVLA